MFVYSVKSAMGGQGGSYYGNLAQTKHMNGGCALITLVKVKIEII